MTLLSGCVSASSADSIPASTSSCTTEWSTVTCESRPSSKRYTRLSPTLNTANDGPVRSSTAPGDRGADPERDVLGQPVDVERRLREARADPLRVDAFAAGELGEPGDRGGTRQVAGGVPAHPVGDGEHRRTHDDAVLVGASPATDVADRREGERHVLVGSIGKRDPVVGVVASESGHDAPSGSQNRAQHLEQVAVADVDEGARRRRPRTRPR